MKSLVAVTLATVLALTAMTWFMPEYVVRHTPEPHVYDFSADPPVGFPLDELSIPRVDARGVDVPVGSGSDLVVLGGDCTGCSVNAVKFSKLPVESFDRIFIVYQASPAVIHEETKSLDVPENVYLMTDETGRVEDSLNAMWTGRWYVFTSGALVRAQMADEDRNWSD